MSTISVVISAYNEEKKIEECLKSVGFADEIVFVDNTSSDNTLSIAKKHTTKFFIRPNNPMLNVNKNFGFSKATSDWVLSLDADERITPELAEEIRLKIKDRKSGIRGYWIGRKNIIFGKWIQHAGWYPDYQLRLFKRGEGRFGEKQVHEMIQIKGNTDYLKSHIIHNNFDSIAQFLHKHTTIYARNEAEVLLQKGYVFNQLDAIRFPLNEFLSRFFAREGYKDGFHGLMLSLLLASYHLMIFSYLWEKVGFKEYGDKNFLNIVSGELKKSFSEVTYWIANEKLKQSKNVAKNFLLRVQRKIRK